MSEAVIPIRAGGFTIGVLALQAEGPDFFGEAEVKLLERAAAMVAARLGEIERLERGRAVTAALAEERSQTERFAALTATVDSTIGPIFRADALFRAACQLPIDLGLCALAWFGLVQTDSSGPRLRAVTSACDGEGAWHVIADIRRMPAAFVGESAIATNRSTVVNDILGDSRFYRGHDALRAAGLRSMMFVPVFLGLRPAAGLAFYGRGVGTFGAREVALLERLGSDVAQKLAAIESLRRLPSSREGIRTLARRMQGEFDCGAGSQSGRQEAQ